MERAAIITFGINKKAQIELCKRYAEVKGYKVILETDSLNAIMETIETKQYEILLYSHIDALGDINNFAKNVKFLRSKNIEVIVVNEKKIKGA